MPTVESPIGSRSSPAPSPGRRWLVACALGVVLATAAACGSSGASSPASTHAAGAKTAGAASATVGTASSGNLGTILVDGSGRTLYHLTTDAVGKSTCTGGCAAVWPPLTVPAGTTHVSGAGGVNSSKLGTITRPGGALQVIFNGLPLYRFSGDTKAGDTKGQGVGGTWFVVSPTAASVTPPPGSVSPTTSNTAAPSSTNSHGVNGATAPAGTSPPATAPPATAPPATAPPATAPPATAPPATAPPATAPPATSPPATSPPTTQSGGYGY